MERYERGSTTCGKIERRARRLRRLIISAACCLAAGCGGQDALGIDAGAFDAQAPIDASVATASLPAWAADGDCPDVALRSTGLVADDAGTDAPVEWIIGTVESGATGMEATQAVQRCPVRASVALGMEYRESFVLGSAFVSKGTTAQANELTRRVDIRLIELNGPLTPLVAR